MSDLPDYGLPGSKIRVVPSPPCTVEVAQKIKEFAIGPVRISVSVIGPCLQMTAEEANEMIRFVAHLNRYETPEEKALRETAEACQEALDELLDSWCDPAPRRE